MTIIAIEKLVAHPDNANRMTDGLLRKLVTQIRETGRYPPIIVRPRKGGTYQILDGHHRTEALRRLGIDEANCEVWDVDDKQATMFLLTLNRLHGVDDPRKRGELLLKLQASRSIRELVKRLPEDAAKIRKLIEFTKPPPALKPPRPLDDLPHPVTFFLTLQQRRHVLARLREHSSDRTASLLLALGIEPGSLPHGES